jgi:hypothetical protein
VASKQAGSSTATEASRHDSLVIERGIFHAYFIYDVADTVDLAKLSATGQNGFEKAQLDVSTVASPSYIQFETPPLAAKLPNVTVDGHEAEARLKLYDYGTLSIRISFPFSGTWNKFAELTRKLRQSVELWSCANRLSASASELIAIALNKPHKPLLEEYFVFEVNSFKSAVTASQLLEHHKRDLSGLLLAESRPLTVGEQEEAVRMYFSYFETDLAVVEWDSAFVLDTRDGAEAVESILEFANTQLVELRTYDAVLDDELDQIYKWDVARIKQHWFFGRKAAAQRTEKLRSLLVDIRELSDRGNNSLKIIGDAFYARLYRGIASRLGLSDWQHQLESKLDSVGEVYRFATDQAQHARSEFLEIIVILLIAMEIVLAFRGRH